MPVPTSITDLSTTASSNYPGGTDSVAVNTGPDDYFRAHASIIRRLQAKGANVASAATVDLGAIADGSYVHITGTTGITSFGTVAAGVSRTVVFDGALTITHNATSMILPGAANITTAAGDVAEFVSEGSGNWRCKTYQTGGLGTHVTHSVDQAVPHNTYTILAFDTETWDDSGLHDTVTNNSRITVSVSGRYVVHGAVRLDSGATGAKMFDVLVNGGTVHRVTDTNAENIGDACMCLSVELWLTAGHYVQLGVQQNTGVSINATSWMTSFSVRRIG